MRNRTIILFFICLMTIPAFAEILNIKSMMWDVGDLLVREKRFTTEKTAIQIENLDDEETIYMGLRIKDAGGLKAGTENDTDEFILRGAFCKDGEQPSEYRQGKDDILHSEADDFWVGGWTSRRFGTAGKLDPGEIQKLFLEFTAPTELTTDHGTKIILIEICARDKDDKILECKEFKLIASIQPIPQAILNQMKD